MTQPTRSRRRGYMWWVDRWRKSTAYTDLTLKEQAAYRNLLDELPLRGGVIPDDERTLSRACGDPLEWPEVRERVLAYFKLGPDGWTHPTYDEVTAFSEAQAAKGKARVASANRDSLGRLRPAGYQPDHQPNSQPGAGPEHPAGHQPPDPDPDPKEESPLPPQGDGADAPDREVDSDRTQTRDRSHPSAQDAEGLADAYADVFPDLPQIRRPLARGVREVLVKALRRHPLEDWIEYFREVRDEGAGFLFGGNDRGWKAGPHFLLRESTRTKWAMGEYRKTETSGNGRTTDDPHTREILGRLAGGGGP